MAQTKNLGRVTVDPRGAYSAGAEYERLDVVSYGGSSWMALQSVSGVTPTAGEYWMQIAQKGEDGDPGAPGDSVTVDGISAVNGNIELDALRYTAMTLSSSEKQTTRQNIGAQETITIDSAMSGSSTNPVQNKVIKAYIDAAMSSAGGDAAPAIYDDATPGDLVTVTDGADDRSVKTLVLNIIPSQSGSGDPSPSNIRPISGWAGANLYQSGADTSDYTTETISWQTAAGIVYGGTLNITTGKLTVTDAYIASYNGETLPSTWISDRDVYAEGTSPTTGAEVVYKVASPTEYTLTGMPDVKTGYGTNNFWTDCGSIGTLTYSCDTKLYVDGKASALLALMSE